jgi:hypothetical protein
MTASTSSPGRSRRALFAKVAGLAGIVICAVLIVVVWLLHGQVRAVVDDLAADVTNGFDRAIAATAVVSDRLESTATNVGKISVDAKEVAGASSPSANRMAGIQDRLAQVADRYRDVRARYVDARENVASAAATLRNLARIVPGVTLPDVPGKPLDTLDAKLQDLDASLTAALSSVKASTPRADAAKALATQTAKVKTAVTAASDAVGAATRRLEATKANALGAIDTIRTIMILGSTALSVLFLWVLLLNVALYLLGRAWQREHEAGAGAPVPASQPPAPTASTAAPTTPSA